MKVLICFFSLFLCLILVSCNHNFIKKETTVTKVEPSRDISTEVLDNTFLKNNLDNFNEMDLLHKEGWSSDAFIAATKLLSQYPTIFLDESELDDFFRSLDGFYQPFMYQSNYAAFDINNDGKPIIIITNGYYEGVSNSLFVFKDGEYQENEEFVTYNSGYEIYTDKQGQLVFIEYLYYDEGAIYSYIINCDGNLKKEIIYEQSSYYLYEGFKRSENKVNESTVDVIDILSNPLILEPSFKPLSPISSIELSKICREMINELTIQPQLLIDGKLTSLEYPIVMDNEIPLMSINDLKDCFNFLVFKMENGVILQWEGYRGYYEVVYTRTEGLAINDEEHIQSPVAPQIINGIWYVPIDFTLDSLSHSSVWIEDLNIEYTRSRY